MISDLISEVSKEIEAYKKEEKDQHIVDLLVAIYLFGYPAAA